MVATEKERLTPQTVPTPALVIDADATRRNIKRLADYADQHDLKVRPHTKTHKSMQLARMQMEAGAIGLTVAKVGEAEVMRQVNGNVLVAYPVVDTHRANSIAQLAHECDITVAADSQVGVDTLASAAQAAGSSIGILVDYDVGMRRTGLQAKEDVISLAQQVDRTKGLRLAGLLFYPGHIGYQRGEQTAALQAVAAKLEEVLDLWHRHGLEANIVSGGSTPTAFRSHLVPQMTEIRPGTYIFNDLNTARSGFCELEDCAARIVCTVVSTAVPGQVVIDAGSKTLTSDRCGPDPDSGHGFVVEYENAKIIQLNEEHGQIDITQCDRPMKVCERITVIPNHICPCVNLQDRVWWLETGKLQPLTVDARGKLV